MAVDFIHFSCELEMGSPEEARSALALFRQLRQEDRLRMMPQAQGFEVSISEAPRDHVLWLHDDDGGNPEAVVAFVLRLARDFDLTGLWGFQYARWSSRRLLEAFGGGAHMVDLGKRVVLGHTCTEDWLDARLAAGPSGADCRPVKMGR